MDAILKTEDLTKRYGKARGIEALSISVAEGEFFGFIGPNGAGKSTTIRTLLGLISPTAGRAELFGLDCVKRRKQILAQVGYLPSEAAFYPRHACRRGHCFFRKAARCGLCTGGCHALRTPCT